MDQYGLDLGGPDRFGPTSGAGGGAGDSYGGAPASPNRFDPTSGAGGGAGDSYGGAPASPNRFDPTSGAGDSYGSAPASPNRFGPTSGAGGTSDPYLAETPDRFGFEVSPSYGSGPRIEPTPKQPRGRFLFPALAGLVAGLLIFGTGGWFLGRSGAHDDPAPTPTVAAPSPTPSASQGVYEQNQIAINQPKFAGSLGSVAEGWLPHLSGCSRSGEKSGPKLNRGEKVRVRCEMDAMSVIFVEYATTADRDKARVATLGQNVDARTLTPGVGAAAERATPSGRTNGNYVEYAYKVSGRTVAGIWWDDNATPVAAYLLAFWKEGTGEKWEPMRDVWARYA
ncbi:hypothetical protein AB0J80_37455 [Actinoplanes sp. NPDC049548]|uniref:hypothetical protein n=1 Tax=Actinoplanes sp. NPDC049548 TaxID=3155152 RepID=UPI003438C533